MQQTAELHDEKHQPELKNDQPVCMPLDHFTNTAYEGLAAGKEEVVVGIGKDWYNKFEPARREIFYGFMKK